MLFRVNNIYDRVFRNNSLRLEANGYFFKGLHPRIFWIKLNPFLANVPKPLVFWCFYGVWNGNICQMFPNLWFSDAFMGCEMKIFAKCSQTFDFPCFYGVWNGISGQKWVKKSKAYINWNWILWSVQTKTLSFDEKKLWNFLYIYPTIEKSSTIPIHVWKKVVFKDNRFLKEHE